MPPFLINFLLTFKKEIIAALLIIGIIIGGYLYFISAIAAAETRGKNEVWAIVNSSPVHTTIQHDTIKVPVPSVHIINAPAVKETIYIAGTDSVKDITATLDTVVTNKDSLGTYQDTLKVTYSIKNNLFSNISLTLAPRKSVITTITNDHLVPIPYNKWGIFATVNTIGEITPGMNYRFADAFTIGVSCQIKGHPEVTVVWHFN